jgi:hypothetical protein
MTKVSGGSVGRSFGVKCGECSVFLDPWVHNADRKVRYEARGTVLTLVVPCRR